MSAETCTRSQCPEMPKVTLDQAVIDLMESIALQCGFRDVSYFVRAFREEKGCTPGSFRRQCRTLTGGD